MGGPLGAAQAVHLRLHAPPRDGEANTELLRFVAKALRVPKSQVVLASGEKSRTKVVRVAGVPPRDAFSVLSAS